MTETSASTQKPDRTLTEADLAALDEKSDETTTRPASDPVNEVFRRFGSVLAIAATLVVWALLVIGVVLRYVTGSSLDFATELPAYLYPWIIAGGVIVAMAIGGHIAADFLTSRLGTRRDAQIQVAVWVFSGVLFAGVALLCIRLFGPLTEQITPILGWPRMGSFAAFVVMAVCLTVQSFARAVHIAHQGRAEHEEAIGV